VELFLRPGFKNEMAFHEKGNPMGCPVSLIRTVL